MQKHVRNYFEEFGYNQFDSIACELCGSHRNTEIHHVEPRSSFGSTTKLMGQKVDITKTYSKT